MFHKRHCTGIFFVHLELLLDSWHEQKLPNGENNLLTQGEIMPTDKFNASGFKKHEKHYGNQYKGMFPLGGLIRVTQVDTTTTIFRAELLTDIGSPIGSIALDNLFNSGWKVKGVLCTESSNVGAIRDISDYAVETGQVTTAAMPATYTVGDVLLLAPDEFFAGAFGEFSSLHPNYGKHSITMAAGTTGSVTTHQIFTVTGLVRMRILVECSTLLVGATARIQLGYTGDTDAFIDDTLATNIDASELWASDVSGNIIKVGAYDDFVLDFITNGINIGYEITTAAITAGVLQFHYVWEPLEADAKVVEADGTGTLA